MAGHLLPHRRPAAGDPWPASEDPEPAELGPDVDADLDGGRIAFLRRSIADLDREHAAGDLGDDDYRSLRAGYERRLRDAEAGRPAPAPPRPLPASAVAQPGAEVGPFQLDKRKVPRRPRRLPGGLRGREIALLGGMILIELCILAAFAAMILYPDLIP